MSDTSLADYLSQLEDTGDLIRISAPVDPKLELSEIVSRVSGIPGKASYGTSDFS